MNIAAHCRLLHNFLNWWEHDNLLGCVSKEDEATAGYHTLFSSLRWSVFKLNSLHWVICLLLGNCLAASCASAYVQCKGFTVLRFLLCLCCVVADRFSVLLRCVHRVWLLIRIGFLALSPPPLYLMTDRPPCYSKRALISSLNLLREILRGVSFLKLLLISLWHTFRNMAAACEGTF